MHHLYASAARAAYSLHRPMAGCGLTILTLLALLLPRAAPAQALVVAATPAGPLTLCAGRTQTLTAAASVPGFNVAGTGFDGTVNALAVQADGKVLVGGEFTAYNGNAAAPDYLLRLNADGSLDAGFNPGGTGASNGYVYALAVQADGKVLVGGESTTYNGNAAAPDKLLRINADGSLDAGFNPGGTGANGAVYALAVQPDGKVLVGGVFTAYNGSAAAPGRVLRLNANGALDNTFNNGGTGTNGQVNALVVQPDGKVLAGGFFTAYNGSAAVPDNLLRLNADGSPDLTFNPGGTGGNTIVYALALQADGKVLVGGFFRTYNGNSTAPGNLLRLNADGSLDLAFNPGGTGAENIVYALAVQPDGKVLAVGSFSVYNGNGLAPDRVLRLNPDGTLDTTFNPGGAGAENGMYAVAVQPDGKVLVGGALATYNGNAVAPDKLLRLNADGSLNNAATVPAGLAYAWSNGATGPSITVSQPGDYQATATTAANGTGSSSVVRVSAAPAATVQVTPAGPLALPAGGSATLTATATLAAFNAAGSGFNGNVFALVVQPDGKVLVGGSMFTYNGNYNVPGSLLRLNADGSLDTGFNPGGAGINSVVFELALQPDGKVLVGGSFTAYNRAAVPQNLVRLNADGSLDAGFNPGGVGFNDTVLALAVLANGQVLVGGIFTAYNGNAAAPDNLMRLNANGSPDAGFNPGGAGPNGTVNALVGQPDGRVLVGGHFTRYNGSAAPGNLLRLNANGLLDASFNPGGEGTGLNGTVVALALQPDGKVLMGGAFALYNGSAAPSNLLRLHADGLLDAGFNPGGAGTSYAVNEVAVQPDGKILVGGTFTAYNGNAAAPDNVLRLNPNGLPDTSFNPGGAGAGLNPGAGTGASSGVFALAVQANGQVLVGGSFGTYNTNAAAPDNLLRLNTDGSLNDAATPLAGATFVFSPGNTAGPTRTVSTAGTYTAIATDPATGCSYPSNAVVVTVALATTAGQAAPTLQLYPNPARGAATLTGAQPGTTVTVLDALGRPVAHATANAAGKAALALPAGAYPVGLPAGVYVVRAGNKAVRLVVE